jgi:hypothetical protein
MILTLPEVQQQVEQLIHATPSGTVRNILTNANIELMHAMAAQKTEPTQAEKLDEQG